MQKIEGLGLSQTGIADFCKRNHINEFAFFGSILRKYFSSKSDVDILVEFEKGFVPGYIRLAGMENEFSKLVGGRKVDINTKMSLSRYFRDEVATEAKVLYAKR